MITYLENNGVFIDSLKSWVKEGDILVSSDVTFESSFIVLGNITSDYNITTNYDLFVFGDIKAKRIHSKRNLFVLGNIFAEDLISNGNVECKAEIKTKNINIGGNLNSNGLDIEFGQVNGYLKVNGSIFIDNELSVSKDILSFEGITGFGKCKAHNIFVKDYITNITTEAQKVLILNDEFYKAHENFNEKKEMPEKILFDDEKSLSGISKTFNHINNVILNNFMNYVKEIEDKYDYDTIELKFENIQKQLPSLGILTENFAKILKLSEMRRIEYIEDFILLLNLKNTTPKFMYDISIVKDVLEGFFEIQKQRVDKLELRNFKRESIIQNLFFLEQRKYLLRESEYKILFTKISEKLK
ncbi:FapA family protein [Fictibacillus sp. FJAT-27399]|uniref:FapA family protein n=1 Tax=Fictibacillus sp. FJAT-27399 TaxID=1729689 RepID=UPI000783ADB7|nr:FapA family protein [Fictibacillus sp. FJAT-27399]